MHLTKDTRAGIRPGEVVVSYTLHVAGVPPLVLTPREMQNLRALLGLVYVVEGESK